MAIESEYLTPDQLKPFLLHPDSLVRARVTGYFRDATAKESDLIPMVLVACDEYLEDDNAFSLGACMDFPLTEGSFFLVLGALSWVNAAESVFVLNEILATMPRAIFEKNRALMARPRIDPRTRKRIERRLDFSTRGSGELWQRLREFSDNAKDEWCPDCVDQSEAEDLVEALTHRREPGSAELVEELHRGAFEDPWLEAFVIDLLGARRIQEAVPILVDCVTSNQMSFLPGKAADALLKIGDVEAIPKIVRQTEWDTYYHLLESVKVLGCLKHPDAEGALLAVLESQDDPKIRSVLCDALLAHFPSRGWELIRRETQAGDPFRRESLMAGLIVTSIVRGRELPEVEVWRQELLTEQELLEEKCDTESQRVRQQRRDKTGRNQPCPCGSGKKFKKCCALN